MKKSFKSNYKFQLTEIFPEYIYNNILYRMNNYPIIYQFLLEHYRFPDPSICLSLKLFFLKRENPNRCDFFMDINKWKTFSLPLLFTDKNVQSDTISIFILFNR